jgi:20S proteasome alpha/beta subunit
MAGYDEVEKKADLFYMDYLATMAELPYCAHGYGGYFTLGTMDAYYKPGKRMSTYGMDYHVIIIYSLSDCNTLLFSNL